MRHISTPGAGRVTNKKKKIREGFYLKSDPEKVPALGDSAACKLFPVSKQKVYNKGFSGISGSE